ncbi:hypothetical protein [Erythrobacter sp. Alg231-14]|uniref:hypothetical protein n=1 Tax=Erythrobacter sp. Alg231-14 TaxID=1922225 RepID=UPI000D561AE9
MSEGLILSIVLLLGSLFLFCSSYAGLRPSWRVTAKLAAIWVGIFGVLFLVADLFELRLPN